MNTPEPCLNCHYCYADALHKDDPGYQAECLKEYRDGQRWEDAREFRATGTIRRLELKTK